MTSVEIVNIFQELNSAGMTVVMLTHELEMARFCKRIVVIQDGLLVRNDLVKDRLFAPEELQRVWREEEAAKLVTGAGE